MPLFRVHMADGRKIDVEAANPKEAGKKVEGPINKIKRVKEASNG